MITIKYNGRLGNKMIMYAIAHIFSKRFNQKICSELPGYPCLINKNAYDVKHQIDIEINTGNIFSIYSEESVDKNLVINDFFQSREIALYFKDDFIKCFEDKNYDLINATIIHYRIGDLSTLYNGEAMIGLPYYEKCLSYIKEGPIYITSDSPDHDNVKYLIDKYDIRLLDLNPQETINYASKFKNKILSLGTFSWWIGLLGNQNNIYYPVQKNYYNWFGDIFVYDNWQSVNENE